MKFLLRLLYFFLFVVLIIVIAGFVLPSDMRIEVKSHIKAPISLIYGQVNVLKNWSAWSEWLQTDKKTDVIFNMIPSGEGASLSSTDSTGNTGSLQILKSEFTDSIDIAMSFQGFGNATMKWNFEETDNKTFTRCSFESLNMDYFQRYFMYFMKKDIEKNLILSLDNLRKICEDLRLSRLSEIRIYDLPAQPSLIIRDTTRKTGMENKIDQTAQKLRAYISRRSLPVTGDPFIIFYKTSVDSIADFAFGIPIAGRTWSWREYNYFERPAGKTVSVTHFGRFDSEKPYMALDTFLNKRNLKGKNYYWRFVHCQKRIYPIRPYGKKRYTIL